MSPIPHPDVPRLDIALVPVAGQATLRLTGEIDLGTSEQLSLAVEACLRQRPAAVCLDLSRVVFCDCAGLNALLRTRAQAGAQGTAFAWHGPLHPGVARLIDLSGATAALSGAQ